MKRIYLDYAATAPTDPDVIEAMKPYFFERFGNASSPHTTGREALAALEESRERLAAFLGTQPAEIVFNSGATEGNNHAIFGVARAREAHGKHIVISPVEHHSVTEPVERLKSQGFRVTYLDVDEHGRVDPQNVKDSITDETILVCVMHASNEIGTIQPVEEIGRITREQGVPFLVDAVQSVGHIPVNVNEISCDLLSLSAHKFYGPKGIGALYIRKGTAIDSFLLGGDQERSRRASTQNVSGAVGLARAIELCTEHMDDEARAQKSMRDRLLKEVPRRIEGSRINGHPEKRLPNNAHFSFEQIEGESLLMSLDMAGISVSMGSACTSGAMEPSHVLRAIGLPDELAYGSLRVTTGRWTKEDDIEYLLEKLPQSVGTLKI